MQRTKLYSVCGLVTLGVLATGWMVSAAAQEQSKSPPQAAVERARKTVKMLDHIYKTAIVLITDKYVHDTDDFAAGAAAVQWFDGITKAGFHEVRLIDATGQPYEDDNVARDDFEKEAIRQIKSGKPGHEQIVEQKGKPYLRSVTAVPVVLEKCIMCHPHYEDAAKGEAIGAISYTVPIE